VLIAVGLKRGVKVPYSVSVHWLRECVMYVPMLIDGVAKCSDALDDAARLIGSKAE
jgi:hypothetical protein